MTPALYWHRLARALGYRTLSRRLWHALQIRAGVLQRRLPTGPAGDARVRAELPDDAGDARGAWRRRAEILDVANAVAHVRAWSRGAPQADAERERLRSRFEPLQRGVIRAFEAHGASLGDPPDFLHDPLSDVRWPSGSHWTSYTRERPADSELKLLWEPSRCAWAWELLRISTWLSEPRAEVQFWRWAAAWDAQNPYGLTPNWVCGQEASLRLIALLFVGCAFLERASEEDCARLTRLAAHTARHVEATIDHTRAMRNNHALSEAAGLLTVGLLFPELKSAGRWASKGRRILERELASQFFADGSYIQHSFNYHRLALDVGLWSAWIAARAGAPLSAAASEPLARGVDFLLPLTDASSGQAPNYGHNDGANVLPLSACAYRDYRPTLQAAAAMFRGTRAFADGAWDEKAIWLGLLQNRSTVPASRTQRVFAAPVGGYYVLRGPRSWAMMRCHTYHERPAQADMLHVDLWYDGVNVLRDAGTFRYFADEPWNRYFGGTAAHNTVELDGCDQMERGPRFLWFGWTRSRLLIDPRTAADRVAGSHDGYRRLPGAPFHTRGLAAIGHDVWLVHDRIAGGGVHEVRLRWRLPDVEWARDGHGAWCGDPGSGPFALRVLVPPGFTENLLRGMESPAPEGWESTHYAQRCPAPTIRCAGRGALPLEFVTVAGPAGAAFDAAVEAVERVPAAAASASDELSRFNALVHAAQSALSTAASKGTASERVQPCDR